MKKSFFMLLAIITVALTSISCSSEDDAIQKSSLSEITNFSLSFSGLSADDVDYDLGTNITVKVPYGTSLNDVVPTITVSDNAASSPVSGVALNFEDGVSKSFIVTAEDGSTKEYTVTVNVSGEVGSGSKLKTYSIDDLYGEKSTSTYTYTDANFVKEISKEADDWGTIINTIYSFEYDSKNQIVAKNVSASNETTIYTYENDVIVKAVYSAEGTAIYTYNYAYNEAGNLVSEKRTDHSDEDSVVEIKFVIENGNVLEEERYGDVYVAVYDDKNNPFVGMYPSAYAAINVGIQHVSTNNPISGTMADDEISYEYNDDNYPLNSNYTYFDGLASVNKTFTYFTE